MKSSPEALRFKQPLRDVCVRGPVSRDEHDRVVADRERSAYESGYRDAERLIGEQLLRQRADLDSLRTGLMARLLQAIPCAEAESEKALVELALTVARRVLAATPVSVELVQALVREALSDTDRHSKCRVVLNPDDYALLVGAGGQPTATPPDEKVSFESSSSISRGGCVIRTPFGDIDATRETRFALVSEAVRGK